MYGSHLNSNGYGYALCGITVQLLGQMLHFFQTVFTVIFWAFFGARNSDLEFSKYSVLGLFAGYSQCTLFLSEGIIVSTINQIILK